MVRIVKTKNTESLPFPSWGRYGGLAGDLGAAVRDVTRRVPHSKLTLPQAAVIRTTVFRRRASEQCRTRKEPATRNRMSTKFAAEVGVPMNDLYGLMIADREKLQGFANLHFTPAASQFMGQHIAARILESLSQ